MQTFQLAPGYEISRILRGGWQLAHGHSEARSDDAIADMTVSADAGITTFDCADIYTGVEELIGEFRQRYKSLRGQEKLDRIRVHTKFVPDLQLLPRIGEIRHRTRHRPIAAPPQDRSHRPRPVPLVGLCGAALAGDRALAG